MRPPSAALYLKEDLANVTFIVPNSHKKGTCRIPAHTQLICARSEVFRAQFYGHHGKPSEVEITDAVSDDFKAFLKYFYFGSVELTNNNVFRVLYLAQKYLIEDLTKACGSFIDELTPDATDTIRLFVEAQRCGSIPKKFWSGLETIAACAIESSEFLLLDRTNLRKFLQSDKLRASEVAIYTRLKAWAEHQLRESDPEEPATDARIRDYLGDDIWLVRYAQMTNKEFSNCLSGDACLTVEEKLDLLLYLGGDSKVRVQVKKRLPLLNTTPRQRDPPRKNSWRDMPLIRTLSRHRVPSRKIPGVTIKTLVAGDGRSFPRPGQRVRITQDHITHWGVLSVGKFRVLNGKETYRGYEQAILTMSIGEKAKIIISRNLCCKDDGVCQQPEGIESISAVVTLHGIK